MKQLGDRFNSGKRKWSLVDFESFEPMVEVLEYGCIKYSAHNWKKGLKVTEIIESMLRHVFELLKKQDIDPESTKSHVGHIQCNAMFLAYVLKHYPELDDRFEDPNYVQKEENFKDEVSKADLTSTVSTSPKTMESYAWNYRQG